MPEEFKKPIHIRARQHITRVANVCDAACREWRVYNRVLPTAFLVGVLLFLIYFVTIAAPLDFPTGSLVRVGKDQSVADVGAMLQSKHIVRSAKGFEIATKLYNSKTHIIPGEYFFSGAEDILTVGRRLARGDYELVPIRVTIPEGANSREMGELLAQKIPDFDEQTFVNEAASKEGYLFPDTYFFLPGEDVDTVLSALEKNFQKHISDPSVAAAISASGRPLGDIVTMASLLEKEAPRTQDRQVIAGILWKRIELGMPLQVDAVFPFIIGKNSLQLTRTDLKTTSPYNTYTNKGLPPGPITNPGIDAILAAATPIKTNYLYYLSDLQSNFHFSVTYAQQLANQNKYLR